MNDSLLVRQTYRAWSDLGSVSLRIEPVTGLECVPVLF